MKGLNMENINNIYSSPPGTAVMPPVIPDKEEKRQIRRQYNKTALILIINMVIFNVISRLVLVGICMFMGGGFSREAYAAGSEMFSADPLLSTLFSIGTPIVSETISILLGVKLLGINFKKLSAREGYGGGTVMKLMVLCLGLQLAAGIIAMILQLIFGMFGLESATADLTATPSFLANALLYFYACLLGPVLEELLYRGVLLQSMRKYNERFAIFLSAAIFGLMHQNYQQFILGFLLGIPLAAITVKYGSIIPSIFTHIVVNTSGMLALCLIQYYAPDAVDDLTAAVDFGTEGNLIIMAIGFSRIALAIAGLVIGIMALVKGGNMSRPTPAGKARSKVFFTAPLWWIVMIAYLFLCFVLPFMLY